jgi:hypothetical protein
MQNHDENFDSLRRALKLKRHEQPPPGFYNNFSRQVISRLRENDVHDRAGVLDAADWEAPWLNRLLGFIQGKPITVGLIGAAACILLIGGIMISDRPEVGGLNVATQSPRLGTPENLAGIGLLNQSGDAPAFGLPNNPLGPLPAGSTLFDHMRSLPTAPAFTPTNLIPQP